MLALIYYLANPRTPLQRKTRGGVEKAGDLIGWEIPKFTTAKKRRDPQYFDASCREI